MPEDMTIQPDGRSVKCNICGEFSHVAVVHTCKQFRSVEALKARVEMAQREVYLAQLATTNAALAISRKQSELAEAEAESRRVAAVYGNLQEVANYYKHMLKQVEAGKITL